MFFFIILFYLLFIALLFITLFFAFIILFCTSNYLFCCSFVIYLLAIFALFFRAPLRAGVSSNLDTLLFWSVFRLLYLCNEHYTNRTCVIYGRFYVSHALQAPSGKVVSLLSYGASCFSEKKNFLKNEKNRILREKKRLRKVFFCSCYGVECRNIRFWAIFSPVERFLQCFPYKLPRAERKRLRTL